MNKENKKEISQAKEKVRAIDTPKVIFKIVLGLGLLILGLLAVVVWWSSVLRVIQGCLGIFLILAGAVAIAVARE